jgi:hypothetical protein
MLGRHHRMPAQLALALVNSSLRNRDFTLEDIPHAVVCMNDTRVVVSFSLRHDGVVDLLTTPGPAVPVPPKRAVKKKRARRKNKGGGNGRRKTPQVAGPKRSPPCEPVGATQDIQIHEVPTEALPQTTEAVDSKELTAWV